MHTVTVSSITFEKKVLKEKSREHLELTCIDQKSEPEFISPSISSLKLHHLIGISHPASSQVNVEKAAFAKSSPQTGN